MWAERGDLATAERLLRSSLNDLRQSQNDNFPAFLSSLAEVLGKASRLEESVAAAGQVLQRIEQNHQLWWLPEALRIKGEVLLLTNKANPLVSEDHFRRSLDVAHLQGALSWKLRAATSLAGLLRDQGRISEARDLLAGVYARFTEGFGTADLQMAKQLLDELT